MVYQTVVRSLLGGPNSPKLPEGYILKNGVKPIKGFKYNHPLDGHGFINAIKISKRGIEYKGIRQETYHYKRELEANEMLYRGLATNCGETFLLNNFNNVSVFVNDDTVYSLGEGGVPYIIDVETGRTIGSKQMGNIPTKFTESLPYFPLSAHPMKVDDDVYNMSCLNYALTIFKNDNAIHTEVFPFGECYYTHDFKVTEDWFVFFLNRVDLSLIDAYFKNKTIFESIKFKEGNKILLVDRKSFKSHYVDITELNMGTLHIAYAHQVDDVIKIYSSLNEKVTLQNAKTPYQFDGCKLHRITIETKSFRYYCSEKLLDIDGEMPVEREGIIYMVNKHTLLKYDTNKDSCLSFEVHDAILEEPVVHGNFVFLVGHMMYHNKTILYCINKMTLTLVHEHIFDFIMPYGFHGTFYEKEGL